MPKRQPPQPKGGRLSDGSPARATHPKRNAGIALSAELLDAIANLPQIQSGEWSKSYLVEQLGRLWLNLPADYDNADLSLIANGEIIE